MEQHVLPKCSELLTVPDFSDAGFAQVSERPGNNMLFPSRKVAIEPVPEEIAVVHPAVPGDERGAFVYEIALPIAFRHRFGKIQVKARFPRHGFRLIKNPPQPALRPDSGGASPAPTDGNPDLPFFAAWGYLQAESPLGALYSMHKHEAINSIAAAYMCTATPILSRCFDYSGHCKMAGSLQLRSGGLPPADLIILDF